MNICFLARDFSADGGGIATYMTIMTRLLADTGHVVHVLAASQGGGDEAETRGNLHVHRFPFVWNNGGYWLPDRSLWDRGLRHLYVDRDPVQAFGWMAAERLRQLIREHDIQIVEAPEYEAPLYFAQLRRLVDPDYPKIPMLVFLHSPSYVVLDENRADMYSRLMVHRRHYEILTMQMADAIVSPSRLMARRAIRDAELDPGKVSVIRLPVDEPPAGPMRTARSDSSVLCVGTLSFIKGTDLAVEAVRNLPETLQRVRARFVGQDPRNPTLGSGMEPWLRGKLQDKEQGRFEFAGSKPREHLWTEYAGAACALNPARWENFPYAATEAMICGCPVIGSRTTGIAEIVEDGVSGILADPTVDGVTAGLKRFFALSADERIRMGEAARSRVRSLCDPHAVLRERVAHYDSVLKRGPLNASVIPAALWDGAGVAARRQSPSGESVQAGTRGSVAIVVTCYNLGQFLPDALDSIKASSRPADEVVVVDDGSTDAQTRRVLSDVEKNGRARVVRQVNSGLVAARNRGLAETAADYVVFLDADDTLCPEYIERAAAVLDRYPRAGAATSWVRHFGEVEMIWAPPLTTFPFLLFENTVATCAMARRAALSDVGGFSEEMDCGYEDWELWIRLVAGGWPILTMPEALSTYRVRADSMLRRMTPVQHGYLRLRMRRRHSELFDKHGGDLALIAEQFYVHSRPIRFVAVSDATARLMAVLGLCRSKLRRPGWLLLHGPGLCREICSCAWTMLRSRKGNDIRVERI